MNRERVSLSQVPIDYPLAMTGMRQALIPFFDLGAPLMIGGARNRVYLP
jgi:hypothetical protein